MTDLNTTIDAARELGFVDPYEIARQVASDLTPKQAREALEETLPLYIRQRERQRRLPPSSAIRDLKRFLDDSHWVDGRWVLARDMTAKQCRWLGADYQKRGESNGERADLWFTIARVLDESPNAKVGTLAEERLLAAVA